MSLYAKNPRLQKEQRSKFKRAGNREVSDDRKIPILDCDNRRSGDAGFVHDVEQTTADALWLHLQIEAGIRELAEMCRQVERKAREEVKSLLSLGGDFVAAVGENYFAPRTPEIEHPYKPLLRDKKIHFTQNQYDTFFRSEAYEINSFKPLVIDPKTFFEPTPAPVPAAPPPVSFEQHEAFLSKARWRYGGNGAPVDLDESWRALQESLEPSLLDEDVLGGFGDWLENFPADNQFLLIGDTNHDNRAIETWKNGGEYIPLLARKGFTDLVVERSIEVNDDIKALYAGYADQDQIRNLKKHGILALCLEAQRHGIQVHALDRQLDSASVKEVLPFRHHNEERLAAEIKDAVGDRKTAVIYGASHFAYENGLYDLLGRSNSRVINLHEGLKDYHDPVVKMNATYPAAYVLVLEEQTVVASKRNYGREVAPSRDDYLRDSVLPAEREKEISKFREKFDAAREADPKKYGGFTVEEIVFKYENAYWMK